MFSKRPEQVQYTCSGITTFMNRQECLFYCLVGTRWFSFAMLTTRLRQTTRVLRRVTATQKSRTDILL